MSALLELRRLLMPLVVIAMIGAAAVTYQMKNEALLASEHVAVLRNDIEEERARLVLLKAEWSELTQPGRIQEFIARYPDVLALAPFGVDRMVRITDIPFAPNQDLIANIANATRPELH
jgi:hypothetical protein